MNAVTKYDEMRAALAHVHRVDDLQNERNKAEALRQYLKRSGESLHDQNLMAEIRLRFDRRSGELLEEAELAQGKRTDLVTSCDQVDDRPTLSDLGISKMQSSRLQAIAKIPEEVFEQHVEETKAEGKELTTASLLQAAKDPSYDGDEWFTPVEIVQAARQVLGDIDLDPANHPAAQEIVNAKCFYTKQDDALRDDLEWIGKVWLNPPYSMPLIKRFVDKLVQQYDAGNVEAAVIITNNSSDTSWFHALLERFPACFTYGRVRFWRPNHEDFGTRQGQTIFYLGDNDQQFYAAFSEIGRVVIAA